MLLIYLVIIVDGNDDWINDFEEPRKLYEQQSARFITNETSTLAGDSVITSFEETTISPRVSLIASSLAARKVERTHSRFRSSSDQSICLNVTAITKAVHASDIVFAGKILTLYEQIPEETNQELPDTIRNEFGYPSKRRRESYFVGDSIRRIQVTPQRPVQQLKPFPRYEALVLIKTVFKGGDKSLEDTSVVVFVDPNDLVEKAGRSLARCIRKLRSHDTRIFFYKSSELHSAARRREHNRRFDNPSFYQSKRSPSGVSASNVSISSSNPGALKFPSSAQTFWPVPPTLGVFDAIRSAVRGEKSYKGL